MSMPLAAVPDGLQTEAFLLGHGVLKSVPELLQTFFPGQRPWIIADGNTWNAAGQYVRQYFVEERLDSFELCIFPAEPRLHPDYAVSRKLAAVKGKNFSN